MEASRTTGRGKNSVRAEKPSTRSIVAERNAERNASANTSCGMSGETAERSQAQLTERRPEISGNPEFQGGDSSIMANRRNNDSGSNGHSGVAIIETEPTGGTVGESLMAAMAEHGVSVPDMGDALPGEVVVVGSDVVDVTAGEVPPTGESDTAPTGAPVAELTGQTEAPAGETTQPTENTGGSTEKIGDVAPLADSATAFKQAVADGEAVERGFTVDVDGWKNECFSDVDSMPKDLAYARRVYQFTKHQVFRNEAFGSCATAAEFWRKSGMLARVMVTRNQTEADAKVTLDNRWQYLKRTVRAEFETVKPKRDPALPTAESILKTVSGSIAKVPGDDYWTVYRKVVDTLVAQYRRDVAAWSALTAKTNAENEELAKQNVA